MSGTQLLGLEEILNTLEEKLGPDRVREVTSKALRKVAPQVEDDLREVSGTFQRTGKIVTHVVSGNVSLADYNIPKVKIGWRKGGRKDRPRWNIEHLNEMGFTSKGKFVRPRGFGKLQGLIDEYESKYPELVQEELKELLE